MTALTALPTADIFTPTYRVIDQIGIQPDSRLAQETMFYQSSPEFVRQHGGPITQRFLDRLPSEFMSDGDGLRPIIDIRVHKLRAGLYPAIPGYHLDWLPRINKGADPDMSVIPDYEHIIFIVGETSLTEYVAEPVAIIGIPEHGAFEYCNDQIKSHDVKTWHVPSGSIVKFTSNDWHRATPAEGSEWRFMIRVSRVAHVRPSNEIRTQSQVYIPIEEATW